MKYCTISQLNEAINSFRGKLTGKDKHNYLGDLRLHPGKAMRIPGSMTQMRTFVMVLPLALRKMLNPEVGLSVAWKLLTTMVKMSWFLNSFALSEAQRQQMGDTYHSYLSLRLALQQEWATMNRRMGEEADTSESMSIASMSDALRVVGRKRKRAEDGDFLKPKHITMIHYCDLVKQIGPLALYSTTNAESRNGQLKKEIIALGSYGQMMHTLKTVVERDEGKHGESLDIYGIEYGEETVKSIVKGGQAEMRLVLSDHSMKMYRSLSYFGSTYRRGIAVAYYELDNITCERYDVGVIEGVFSNGEVMKLVIRECESDIVEDLACLKIGPKSTKIIVEGRQLAAHTPFSIVSLDDGKFCPLRVLPTCF